MGSDSILYRAIVKNEQQRHNAYCALFKAPMDGEMLVEVRECTNKGWALRGGRFQSKIERLTERRAKPLPKDRPKLKS